MDFTSFHYFYFFQILELFKCDSNLKNIYVIFSMWLYNSLQFIDRNIKPYQHQKKKDVSSSDIWFFNWSFTKSYCMKNINVRVKSTDYTGAQIFCLLFFCPFIRHLESLMVMLLMWHILVKVLDNKGPLSFINLTLCVSIVKLSGNCEEHDSDTCLIKNTFHISQFRWFICISLVTFAIVDFSC